MAEPRFENIKKRPGVGRTIGLVLLDLLAIGVFIFCCYAIFILKSI